MGDGKGIQVIKGDPRVLGVTRTARSYNFAVAAKGDAPVSLLLYKKGSLEPAEEIIIPGEWKTGEVAALCLMDFEAESYEYNYRIGKELVRDPGAAVLVGKGPFGTLENRENPHQVRCGFLPEKEYDWGGDTPLKIPYSQTILYKLNIRGYTKQKNSKVRHKGTFLGITEKIPYFAELGINGLLLMPAYEFDEVMLPENMPMEYAAKMKSKYHVNFWGYTKGSYFAPKAAYCATKEPVTEVKDMVRELHKNNIQCMLEFYFPRTMNPVQVMQILRYWHLEYHIDGFHLLGEGVPQEILKQDPLLKQTKLLFDRVSCEEDGVSAGQRNLGEYNDDFKQNMRRFLKSDEDSLGQAVMLMRRNPPTHGVINYLTDQNGFTLMDLVSYDEKHNEANGEENQDGNPYNFSWNCGAEGPSRKLSIRQLRKKQMRNAFLFLLLSQGTPMLYGGDEFGNSQQGNNNAYCQDNDLGWVDWKAYTRNKEMTKFVKAAIEFRKAHGVFCQDSQLKVMDYRSLGYPDISYHSSRAWYAAYENTCRHIGMMYCGDYVQNNQGKSDSFFYVAYNFHWESHEFALPKLPKQQQWHQILETAKNEDGGFWECEEKQKNQKMVSVPPRSICIYIGK